MFSMEFWKWGRRRDEATVLWCDGKRCQKTVLVVCFGKYFVLFRWNVKEAEWWARMGFGSTKGCQHVQSCLGESMLPFSVWSTSDKMNQIVCERMMTSLTLQSQLRKGKCDVGGGVVLKMHHIQRGPCFLWDSIQLNIISIKSHYGRTVDFLVELLYFERREEINFVSADCAA